jgi:hypothetical protein
MAEEPDFVEAWLTARAELERVFEHLDRQEYVSFAEELAGATGRVFFTGQDRLWSSSRVAGREPPPSSAPARCTCPLRR